MAFMGSCFLFFQGAPLRFSVFAASKEDQKGKPQGWGPPKSRPTFILRSGSSLAHRSG